MTTLRYAIHHPDASVNRDPRGYLIRDMHDAFRVVAGPMSHNEAMELSMEWNGVAV